MKDRSDWCVNMNYHEENNKSDDGSKNINEEGNLYAYANEAYAMTVKVLMKMQIGQRIDENYWCWQLRRTMMIAEHGDMTALVLTGC